MYKVHFTTEKDVVCSGISKRIFPVFGACHVKGRLESTYPSNVNLIKCIGQLNLLAASINIFRLIPNNTRFLRLRIGKLYNTPEKQLQFALTKE